MHQIYVKITLFSFGGSFLCVCPKVTFFSMSERDELKSKAEHAESCTKEAKYTTHLKH